MAFKRSRKQDTNAKFKTWFTFESNVEKLRDWSELPYDILELISRKLHYIDQLNSRAVCKTWSAINGVPSLKQKMPWLLTFNFEEEADDGYSCILIDPNYKKTYNMSMNIIKEKNLINLHVHESKYGWLLISSQPTPEPPPNGEFPRDYPNGASFFLFTPFLTHNNFIELPVHTSPFSIATFSSDPSNEDFILLTMHAVPNTVSISTYCLGEDSSWKIHNFNCDFSLICVKSIVYSNGEFFCSSIIGRLGIFNVAQKDWTLLPEPLTPLAVFQTLVVVNVLVEILEIYLVKSDTDEEDNEEEIFLVYLRNIPWPYARLRMCVFRLDRAQMIWERVYNIGSRIMFLGSGCTSFVRRERSYRLNDRVYFIWDNKMKHCTVSLAIRSHTCSSFYGPLSKEPCQKVWIEPPQHC